MVCVAEQEAHQRDGPVVDRRRGVRTVSSMRSPTSADDLRTVLSYSFGCFRRAGESPERARIAAEVAVVVHNIPGFLDDLREGVPCRVSGRTEHWTVEEFWEHEMVGRMASATLARQWFADRVDAWFGDGDHSQRNTPTSMTP